MKLSDIPTGFVVFIDANVPLAVIFGESESSGGEPGDVDFVELVGACPPVKRPP